MGRIAKRHKRCKKGGNGCKKGRANNVVVTYRTSSGLKRETLVLRARRTFREGFVAQQTQTTPDNDDDGDDEEVQERTLSIKLASPLI